MSRRGTFKPPLPTAARIERARQGSSLFRGAQAPAGRPDAKPRETGDDIERSDFRLASEHTAPKQIWSLPPRANSTAMSRRTSQPTITREDLLPTQRIMTVPAEVGSTSEPVRTKHRGQPTTFQDPSVQHRGATSTHLNESLADADPLEQWSSFDPSDADSTPSSPEGLSKAEVSVRPPKAGLTTDALEKVEDHIPPRFQSLFPYPFNRMQSKVLPSTLRSDENVVVSAPTGSGKTAVLEMAMCRLFETTGKSQSRQAVKVIYLAPAKALCQERYTDWSTRFGSLGIKVKMWTGDVEGELSQLAHADVITTTPGNRLLIILLSSFVPPLTTHITLHRRRAEKWHSTTKKWRDEHESVVASSVGLVLIDECHHIGDSSRGATLEAVVSRIKTMHQADLSRVRFVAVSATIPNLEDCANWLGSGYPKPAAKFEFSADYRPVSSCLCCALHAITVSRRWLQMAMTSLILSHVNMNNLGASQCDGTGSSKQPKQQHVYV